MTCGLMVVAFEDWAHCGNESNMLSISGRSPIVSASLAHPDKTRIALEFILRRRTRAVPYSDLSITLFLGQMNSKDISDPISAHGQFSIRIVFLVPDCVQK